MSSSFQPLRYSMFRRPVREQDVRRLSGIQLGALLPVSLCLTFFLISANIYLLFLFLFLLIIGVLIPWILQEILSSHLVLRSEMESLKADARPVTPSEKA